MAEKQESEKPVEQREVPSVVDQLRDAIKLSGHSLNQLSVECGVGRDRLSRFMRGERDLTLQAVEQVCRVLRLHLVSYEQQLMPPVQPDESQSAEKQSRKRRSKE